MVNFPRLTATQRLNIPPVVVIGLGRFGGAVATELHRLGNRVTALELDPRLAESYLGRVGRTIQGDATAVTTIEEIKPHAFSASVLAIGSSIEASVLAAVNLIDGEAPKVRQWVGEVNQAMKNLRMDPAFAERNVNEGFSGGEKKRNEIFQMAMLEPKLAILDETDSGLDIDALRIVAKGVNELRSPETSTIVITHYQRLLDYIRPDYVHVLYKGRIVRSGGPELALELEKRGYDWIKEEVGE